MISIVSFFLWYVTITLLGWLAFPIAYRLLPALPDRGYTLARALGLLAWGFIFWLLASLGVLQNSVSGVTLALCLVAGLTAWAVWGKRFPELREWVQSHKKLIVVSEVVFLAAFAILAFIRAANPDISGTEKPMELAFINSILRSPAFPPNDPWLSGYAISYYYFGYVIVTLLIRVTGVDSGIAFNLAVALWFALTALGAYGILFNLLRTWLARSEKGKSWDLYSLPLLGPLFILVVSNLEGILDSMHSLGLFWTAGTDGVLQSSFWKWLNIAELTDPPLQPYSWLPTRPSGVLWWRASRVVQDYALNGSSREIIDEFPFFSFLLGDLHPHVLAMPFVLLAVGLALNLFLGGGGGRFKVFGFTIPLSKPSFGLAIVALGGLAFLNTWDFPFYVVLFCGAYVFAQYLHEGWSTRRLAEFLGLALALGISSVVIYLPFYVGFQSQAGGFLPSLIYFTRGTYFWVMFAPLLLPILAFMVYLWRKSSNRAIIRRTLALTAALMVGLLALSFLFGFAISLLPSLGNLFLGAQGADTLGIGALISSAFMDRVASPGTWITLGIVLALVLALMYRVRPSPKGDDASPAEDNGGLEAETGPVNTPAETEVEAQEPARLDFNPVTAHPHAFIFLLILVGALLALFPEFFYLQDQFGWRINTIFKFYFETWILWGLAAAYGLAVLLHSAESLRGRAVQAGLLVLAGMTLIYPVFGLANKTNNFKPSTGLTLDGNAFVKKFSLDEWAGIAWLQSAPLGVLVEAVGGDYTDYARVSTRSGQSAILGWPGHVSQWRGGSKEMGSRQTDIQTLYQSTDWQTTLKIIREYQIKYIYVGNLEHSAYRVSETKFKSFLRIVFQQGNVTIYEVPDQLETSAQPAQIVIGAP
jgi:YYY domain-containing protein